MREDNKDKNEDVRFYKCYAQFAARARSSPLGDQIRENTVDREEYVRYEPLLARRCWAATLDYLFYFGMFYIYVRFVGTENEQGVYEAKGFSHILAVVLIWFIYFPVMEGIVGYTVFKGLFDLKVVQERRQDYRFIVALKRHLLDPIDFFFFGIVAIILVKVGSDHKRLGDIIAHSRVVMDKDDKHEAPPSGQSSVAGSG